MWFGFATLLAALIYVDSRSALGPRSIDPRLTRPTALRLLGPVRGPASAAQPSSHFQRIVAVSEVPIEQEPFVSFDRHGLIVQSDGDGGDTAQRTGMFYFVFDDREAFTRALDLLEVEPGTYVRHPYQPGFRSNPDEFSRDQQRPLVIALGAYKMHDRLWRMAKQHLRRLGRYQNRDVIGPSHVGEYIRSFRSRPLYPVLLFTDTALLANSLRIVFSRHDPDHVDDNNHVMSLAQSRYTMPTPASWLARKIYKKFRPMNAGNILLRETSPVQGALCWYHRAENGGNPLIAEAYRGVVENL